MISRRRKLMLLITLLIIILILILVSSNTQKVVVIEEKGSNTAVYSDQNIIKIDYLLDKPDKKDYVNNNFKADKFGIANDQYTLLNPNKGWFCNNTKEGSIIYDDGDKIVIVTTDIGLKKYDYYLTTYKSNSCDLVASISDVDFTKNIIETYANNSIYSSFSSLVDPDVSGMLRIQQQAVYTMDKADKKYINPIPITDGVLFIENDRDLVAFNATNMETFRQNNEKTGKQIFAINKLNNNVFTIVKKDKKIYVEIYDLLDVNKIVKGEFTLQKDITDLFPTDVSEFNINIGTDYASISANNVSLIFNEDFSVVYELKNADDILDITNSLVLVKEDEELYIYSLELNVKQNLGPIHLFSSRIYEKGIYINLLDSNGNQYLIKYNVK